MTPVLDTKQPYFQITVSSATVTNLEIRHIPYHSTVPVSSNVRGTRGYSQVVTVVDASQKTDGGDPDEADTTSALVTDRVVSMIRKV